MTKSRLWLPNMIYAATMLSITVAMVSVVVAGVVFRYVLQSPLVYSFDLSTLLFAWMIFLGLVVADQQRAHLGVDVFVVAMSPRWFHVMSILSDLAVLAVSGILTWYGYRLTVRTGLEITSMRISIRWLYASLPVGMGMFAVWTVIKIAYRLRNGTDIRDTYFHDEGQVQ